VGDVGGHLAMAFAAADAARSGAAAAAISRRLCPPSRR
jgi:hypothetical protein